MPVTTRRRAAAIAANRTALKTPHLRRASTTPPPPINTSPPKSKTSTISPTRSKKTGSPIGHARRKKSLPPHESHEIACRFGHRLYDGEALLSSKATISPKLRDLGLVEADLQYQARFYERKLAQVSADLAASGEIDLWDVHCVVDIAVGTLRALARGQKGRGFSRT